MEKGGVENAEMENWDGFLLFRLRIACTAAANYAAKNDWNGFRESLDAIEAMLTESGSAGHDVAVASLLSSGVAAAFLIEPVSRLLDHVVSCSVTCFVQAFALFTKVFVPSTSTASLFALVMEKVEKAMSKKGGASEEQWRAVLNFYLDALRADASSADRKTDEEHAQTRHASDETGLYVFPSVTEGCMDPKTEFGALPISFDDGTGSDEACSDIVDVKSNTESRRMETAYLPHPLCSELSKRKRRVLIGAVISRLLHASHDTSLPKSVRADSLDVVRLIAVGSPGPYVAAAFLPGILGLAAKHFGAKSAVNVGVYVVALHLIGGVVVKAMGGLRIKSLSAHLALLQMTVQSGKESAEPQDWSTDEEQADENETSDGIERERVPIAKRNKLWLDTAKMKMQPVLDVVFKCATNSDSVKVRKAAGEEARRLLTFAPFCLSPRSRSMLVECVLATTSNGDMCESKAGEAEVKQILKSAGVTLGDKLSGYLLSCIDVLKTGATTAEKRSSLLVFGSALSLASDEMEMWIAQDENKRALLRFFEVVFTMDGDGRGRPSVMRSNKLSMSLPHFFLPFLFGDAHLHSAVAAIFDQLAAYSETILCSVLLPCIISALDVSAPSPPMSMSSHLFACVVLLSQPRTCMLADTVQLERLLSRSFSSSSMLLDWAEIAEGGHAGIAFGQMVECRKTLTCFLVFSSASLPHLPPSAVVRAVLDLSLPLLSLANSSILSVSASATECISTLAKVRNGGRDGSIASFLSDHADYILDKLDLSIRRGRPSSFPALTQVMRAVCEAKARGEEIEKGALPSLISSVLPSLSSRISEAVSGSLRGGVKGMMPFFSSPLMSDQLWLDSLTFLIGSAKATAAAVYSLYTLQPFLFPQHASSILPAPSQAVLWFGSDDGHSSALHQEEESTPALTDVIRKLENESDNGDRSSHHAEYISHEVETLVEEIANEVCFSYFTSGEIDREDANKGSTNKEDVLEDETLEGEETTLVPSFLSLSLCLTDLLPMPSSYSREVSLPLLSALSCVLSATAAAAHFEGSQPFASSSSSALQSDRARQRAQEEKKKAIDSGEASVKLVRAGMERMTEALQRSGGEGGSLELPAVVYDHVGRMMKERIEELIRREARKEKAQNEDSHRKWTRKRALQKHVLPFLAQIWPRILPRVHSTDAVVACAAVETLCRAVTCAGDFMSTRLVEELWPALDSALRRAWTKQEEGGSMTCLSSAFAELAWMDEKPHFSRQWLMLLEVCGSTCSRLLPLLHPDTLQLEDTNESCSRTVALVSMTTTFFAAWLLLNEGTRESEAADADRSGEKDRKTEAVPGMLSQSVHQCVQQLRKHAPLACAGVNDLVRAWRVEADQCAGGKLASILQGVPGASEGKWRGGRCGTRIRSILLEDLCSLAGEVLK